MMIKLGDATLEYSPNFKLFLTTKLANPHYPPEVCVTVCLLNFVTTAEGLSDQLLAILVKKDFPEMEDKRVKLIVDSAASKAELKSIEDEILFLLANSTGNILDDEKLISTLANSKVKSVKIEESVASQERTSREIIELRKNQQPVADRSASLFFVVSDLQSIEPMYQYSLEWFISIYLNAIDTAEKAKGAQRLKNLNDKFISLLFGNVCRSLFEKDKLLFSILLTLKMLYFDDEADADALTLFFTGGGGAGAHTLPKPTGEGLEWMADVMWGKLLELEKLHEPRGPEAAFYEFCKNFDAHAWTKVFDADIPQDVPWPGDCHLKMATIEKALVLLAIRPDALVAIQQAMVIEKLGPAFLEPPPFNLEISFSTSTPQVPLIFVLTSGADPGAVLYKFATAREMKDKLKLISLGQGQGPKANAELDNGTVNGCWVVLQNCHLATSYMPILEGKVESFETMENIHDDFRLWLTSMPAETFPVMVLQNGIKMTVEPPKGLKANMTLAYHTLDAEWVEKCDEKESVLDTFKTLLFGVCFFHALALDRRKYGPLGWNIPYQFSDPDREISIQQLKMFLIEFDDIQWEALNYLIAECNYGGRVTDGQDRRTIKHILATFLSPKCLEPGYKYSLSGIFHAPPPTDRDGYLAFIKEMPLLPAPEVHWLHQNASLTALINEGMACMRSVVSLMPKGAGGGGKSTGERYKEIAKDIDDRLPKSPYDTEAVLRKFPPKYDDSLNVVLLQELSRFNKLFVKVASTIRDLQKAVDGLVVFSAELEDVGNACLEGKVPAVWKKVSFASLKPLGAYVNDFLKRLHMIDEWIARGSPVAFWISGFFFTPAFLTGIMQNMARRDKVAIDEVTWNFYVQPKKTLQGCMDDPYVNEYTVPEIGCYIYGLFMEGARWDDDRGCIHESLPKVLFDMFPVILMVPITKANDKTPPNVYNCPVYKTSERRGVLSTTGHSTNFVMTMQVPILADDDDETTWDDTETYWIRRGTAMLTGLDE